MVKFENINLLVADVDYICHQVNCSGAMGSGVAKAIRDKWPIVYTTYRECYNEIIEAGKSVNELLGNVLFVHLDEYQPKTWPKQPTIVNMFAQLNYGYDGKRYTSYDSFATCLERMKSYIPFGSKIAFPYKIGCDRGGANWEVIFTMIKEYLGDNYDITFCYLEPDNWLKENVVDIEWRDK